MEAHQHKIRKEKSNVELKTIPFNLNDLSLKNTTIKEITYSETKKIILEYEWLKKMPLFNIFFFGIFFHINGDEYLGGVLIFSKEYSSNKLIYWGMNDLKNQILLLSRGVCLWWTPKNTASYFIAKTLKWLKNSTDYKIITATVDPAAGEIGTIYQSLNWHYVGLLSGNYHNKNNSKMFSIFVDGKLKHSTSLINEIGTMERKEILKHYPDAIFLPRYRKMRYFYFIGNKKENKYYYDKIKHLMMEYPKRNTTSIFGIIYLINNKINNKKYVGQTTRGFINRYNEYISGAKSCNRYVTKSINKYGLENFEFSIIDTANNFEELNNKEIKHIQKYDTTNRNCGYNIESGGVNSKSNIQTIKKLSNKRKNIKQNKEWIKKRIEKISKPVLKIDNDLNIVERYKSLSDAGRINNDNLSHQTILRLCLGKSIQSKDHVWCYEEDFINNTTPIHEKQNIKKITEFNNDKLESIYRKYLNDNISIRKLSEESNINFSTLSNIIKKFEKKENIFDNNNQYTLICKKTNKKFVDYKNKSGVITKHIVEIYPKLKIESKFKRKKIELKTGKPWYSEYFDILKNEI